MRFERFEPLLRAAQHVRDAYAPDMAPWFSDAAASWPPVIGFGLPADGVDVTLVTIALNPSNREIELGHVPADNDPAVQWAAQRDYFQRGQLDWYNASDMFLRAAVGRVHREGIPHLDLAPQPTSSGFDATYDKVATPEQRQTALKFLARGVRETLLPTLDLICAHHGLQRAVLYGFVPALTRKELRGSRTMREFFWVNRIFIRTLLDVDAGMHVARGRLDTDHPWLRPHQRLKLVEFLFVARGPSTVGGGPGLARVGQRVRGLAWLP